MIIRDKPGLRELLFALRGSVLPVIAPSLVVVALAAAAVVAVDRFVSPMPHVSPVPFTVFGVALSLFLGFRNNAAYDRWWEARKLWGGLLADMRSLAREVAVFCPDPATAEHLLRGALVFLHAHRLNLRRLPMDTPQTAAVAGAAHPPCAALDRLNDNLAEAHRAGIIDGFGARALSGRLASMALQQAGCERIAGSPLPFVYSLLIYRTTFLYCLLLPLALNATTGWMTPVFVGVVAYMFLGLAEVTEELSHPFAPTQNGIALDASGRFLYVAVTRGNAVWRGPLLPDGSISKVGVFRSFFGTSGPDGLAVDCENRVVVAHASLGGAFVMNARGEVTHYVRSPVGQTVTNVAFVPGTSKLVLTDSEQGHVLIADLPGDGEKLFSHA